MRSNPDPGIFKAYDIRGIHPDQITADVAVRIGRAFVAFLGAKRIAVGRDMRLSSPELAAELQAFVKARTLPHKYPRWVEFVAELPKTTTGKIQRYKLRAQNAG